MGLNQSWQEHQIGNCLNKTVNLFIDKHLTNSSIEQFRDVVKRTCSSENERLVVSYDRSILSQTGTGHFSPIGSYEPSSDKGILRINLCVL